MTAAQLIESLRAEQARQKMSFFELGRLSGMSATNATRILNGETKEPGIDKVARIATALRKTLSLLPMNSRQKDEFREKSRKAAT